MLNWSSITGLEREGLLPMEGVASPPIFGLEKVLFIGDIHLPFHDPLVLEQVFIFLETFRFDRVVVNGDLLDFYDISRFVKKANMGIGFDEECELGKLFFRRLRATVGDECRIDYTTGNHEIRFEHYLQGNAKRLETIECLELGNLLELGETGVVLHPRSGFDLRSNFRATHGETVSKHSGRSAQGELERWHKSGISNHTHRGDQFSQMRSGDWLRWKENYCLCDCNPSYIDGPVNWMQGFTVGWFGEDLDSWFKLDGVEVHNQDLRLNTGESFKSEARMRLDERSGRVL